MPPIIGITIGDPAGIGPEIIEKALNNNKLACKVVLYGALPKSDLRNSIPQISHSKDILNSNASALWFPLMQETKFIPGFPSRESGQAAYEALKRAGKDAVKNIIDAIVTAPISKHYIQLSHQEFIGHTEFFAQQSHCQDVVMSFFSNKINVALLTTHYRLADISKSLSIGLVRSKISIINTALKDYFHIEKPKLALLGLNPHTGEEGAFGNEEIEIFLPAIEQLRSEGIEISDPYPADTFFAGKYQDFDMVICAYHDQALIPFKMLSFDSGVNVTLGLPFIRTSVDHGTAFDIAGKNVASDKSLVHAIRLAEKMVS
ncbi:MAG: 4-hydroxythreonine-4-phosphate dehydrogenase PdxA [Candidatus Cloacimonetes bacterium]|nr:4-hydroxythreonine-4-phosphate dehydrogenase PdxA [Candidatus Cloacimonadota bacterium]